MRGDVSPRMNPIRILAEPLAARRDQDRAKGTIAACERLFGELDAAFKMVEFFGVHPFRIEYKEDTRLASGGLSSHDASRRVRGATPGRAKSQEKTRCISRFKGSQGPRRAASSIRRSSFAIHSERSSPGRFSGIACTSRSSGWNSS